MPSNAITVAHTSPLIDQMVGESLHVKQVESITNAAIGVVHAVSLSIHAIGAGLAAARGLQSKHAVKQVDRLLSNPALDIWARLRTGCRTWSPASRRSWWRWTGPTSTPMSRR